MDRTVWTDERLDDLAANTERSFDLLRQEFRELREENQQEHRAMRADISALRSDLSAWQRQITQIGWAMAGTLIAAVVALVIGVLV